jgi:hypothetical protein
MTEGFARARVRTCDQALSGSVAASPPRKISVPTLQMSTSGSSSGTRLCARACTHARNAQHARDALIFLLSNRASASASRKKRQRTRSCWYLARERPVLYTRRQSCAQYLRHSALKRRSDACDASAGSYSVPSRSVTSMKRAQRTALMAAAEAAAREAGRAACARASTTTRGRGRGFFVGRPGGSLEQGTRTEQPPRSWAQPAPSISDSSSEVVVTVVASVEWASVSAHQRS